MVAVSSFFLSLYLRDLTHALKFRERKEIQTEWSTFPFIWSQIVLVRRTDNVAQYLPVELSCAAPKTLETILACGAVLKWPASNEITPEKITAMNEHNVQEQTNRKEFNEKTPLCSLVDFDRGDMGSRLWLLGRGRGQPREWSDAAVTWWYNSFLWI